MTESGTATTVVSLDARTMSVRELTDQVLSAFDAGLPVCVSGPAWKRPTIASVIDAICATTGARGQWRYLSVETPVPVVPTAPAPSVLLNPPVVPDEEGEDLTDLLLLEDLARAAQAPRPEVPETPPVHDTVSAAEPAPGPHADLSDLQALAEMDLAVSDGEASATPGDASNDDDWAVRVDLADVPAWPAPEPEPEPEPEPVLPPVQPLTGDAAAEATYAYLALLQPVMTSRLHVRPESDGIMGAPSETAALAAMRELAELTEL